MAQKLWLIRIDVENYRSFKPALEFFDQWVPWIDKFREEGWFASEWRPVEMVLFEGEEGEVRKERKKPIPDFTGGYVADACSERARKIIEALVNGQVEFLPLITPVGPYYEMNIQRLSCLDVEHSIIDYLYPEEKRKIFKVIKYAFHWERLEGQHIFWIREVGTTPTFVSDEFKRLVEENNLTGLLFYPVSLVEGQ
jgi:hypothetical protein